MKLAVLLAALTVACSTKQSPRESARPPVAWQFTTVGTAQTLRFDSTSLLFCNGGGLHRVELKSGMAASLDSPCPPAPEPDTACASFEGDIAVRAPLSEPNDIVDLGASSFPLRGRVQDCAAAADRYVAIATGSAVILIDRARNSMREVAGRGAERVAVTAGWIAWAEESTVHLAAIR
jgi:hypothetical protein